jgi:hypothetical protein
MMYHQYMGLNVAQLRAAINFICSHRRHYSDADKRLAFLACELSREVAR